MDFGIPKNVSCVNMGFVVESSNRQTIVRFYDMLILPDVENFGTFFRVVSVGASHFLEWKQPRQPGEFAWRNGWKNCSVFHHISPFPEGKQS